MAPTRLYRNGVLEAEGFPVYEVSNLYASTIIIIMVSVTLYAVFRRKGWL